MLDNRVEFMIALFAIMANRAILVRSPRPRSSTTPATSCRIPAGARDLRRYAKAVLGQLRPGSPSLRAGVEEAGGAGGFRRRRRALRFREAGCRREDIITVYYTSGTTGAPKGCMLHHGWWLRGGRSRSGCSAGDGRPPALLPASARRSAISSSPRSPRAAPWWRCGASASRGSGTWWSRKTPPRSCPSPPLRSC